jgi:two-component system sensor histidine kinase PilS (NtrC family)
MLYVLLSICFFYTIKQRHSQVLTQTTVQVIVDIIILSILMFATDNSGISMSNFIFIAIALGSLFVPGQVSLLFAAIATIMLLCGHMVTHYFHAWGSSANAYVGITGIHYFVVAYLAYALSNRLKKSEFQNYLQQRALLTQEELNQQIIEQFDRGLIVLDPSQGIRFFNQRAQELLEQPLSHSHILLQELLSRWQNKPDAQAFLYDLKPQQGVQIYVHCMELHTKEAGPLSLLLLQSLEEYVQESQGHKMAALGRLAGGVAHELRNPLSAISQATQLLTEDLQQQEEARKLLDIIQHHTQRINHIVDRIMSISRSPVHAPEEIILNQYLTHYREQWLTLHPHTEFIFKSDLNVENDRTEVDPIHLNQILNNLIDNAVRYSLEHSGQAYCEITLSQTADQRISLQVSDRGPGMSKVIQAMLFEPFFTTSPQGSGLGLYLCKRFCELNKIEIHIINTSKQGSCFELIFP